MQQFYIFDILQKLANPKKFFLKADGDGKEIHYEIKDMEMEVVTRQMEPNLYLDWSKRVENAPANYYFDRTEITHYSIPKSKQFVSDTLLLGKAASHVTVGILKTDAYLGKYSLSPQNFGCTFTGGVKLQKLNLTLNGNPIDGQVMRDDKALDYLRTQTIRNTYLTESNGLTYADFTQGSYFAEFDLTPKFDSSSSKHEIDLGNGEVYTKRGYIRVSARFNKDPTENLTLIVIARIPSRMSITKE